MAKDAASSSREGPSASQLPSERSPHRVLGWTISVAIHLGLICLAFFVTWAVIVAPNQGPRPVINASFEMPAYVPLLETPAGEATTLLPDTQPAQTAEQLETQSQLQQQAISELAYETTTELTPTSGAPSTDFSTVSVEKSASFGGLEGTNVKRVVFVIDASGSMLSLFTMVVQELARSLEGLDFEQVFGVIFFQEDAFVMVPPRQKLVPATPENKRRTLDWIEANVFPGESSNPMAALQKAISLNPDVIFLLSDNITGERIYEIDRTELLAMLDEANPVLAGSDQRRTRIMCIQFLHPDPLNTLQEIAEIHGGPGAFKFLDAAELESRQ